MSRHLVNEYPNNVVPEEKRRRPYVDFIKTSRNITNNVGDATESKELFRFFLDISAGTRDTVEKYSMKGWPIIGYANLLARGFTPSAVNFDEMTQVVQQHEDIKSFCDLFMDQRERGDEYIATLRSEIEKGIEAKLRAELAKEKTGRKEANV